MGIRYWLVPLVAVGFALGGPARAQESSPPPESAPSEPDPEGQVEAAPEPAATDPRDLVSEAYWRKANQWLGSKHDAAGRLLLRDLSREMPDTRWGAAAAQWLREHRGLDHGGMTEFVVGSTLSGGLFAFSLLMGFEDYLGPDGGEVIIWGGLGGALAGLGTSLLVGPHINVSDSQAMWLNFNGLWGLYNGLIVYDLIRPFEGDEAFLAGAIGMGVGIGATAALWKYLDVDEGAVQFAQSLGLFAFEAAALTCLVAGDSDVFRTHEIPSLVGLLLPANAAVIGGYFAGNALQWPADDIRYISLGGILGNLLGVAILASTEPESTRAAAGTVLGSMVAGLGAAVAIVRPWRHAGRQERDDADLSAGSGSLLSLDRHGLRTGIPSLQIAPVEYRGKSGVGLQVPLLSVDL